MKSNTLTTYVNKTVWHSIATITIFALLMALSARVRIDLGFTPVPITMQVMVVILSGLVLGARGGVIVQMSYLGMIALNFPVDTNMVGMAALFGPTAGYLLSYPLAAFVAGRLSERWSVQNHWGNFVAGLAAVLVIYLFGATWLAVVLGSWQVAWVAGVAPFILVDVAKSAVAAGIAESGKLFFRS